MMIKDKPGCVTFPERTGNCRSTIVSAESISSVEDHRMTLAISTTYVLYLQCLKTRKEDPNPGQLIETYREERHSKRAKHLEIVEEQAGAITRSDPDVDKPMDDSFGQTLDAEGLAKDVKRLTKAIECIVKRNQELEQQNKDLEGINRQLAHANTELSIEVMSLKEELANSRKGSSKCSLLSVVEDNDKKVKLYTSLPTYLVFLAFLNTHYPKLSWLERAICIQQHLSTKGRGESTN